MPKTVPHSKKQFVILRTDLQMSKGMACAWAATGGILAALRAQPAILGEWLETGCNTIVLAANDVQELTNLGRDLIALGFENELVSLKQGKEAIGLAIGPIDAKRCETITNGYELFA